MKLLHAGILTVDVTARMQRLGTDKKQTAVTIPHPEQRGFLTVACLGNVDTACRLESWFHLSDLLIFSLPGEMEQQ